MKKYLKDILVYTLIILTVIIIRSFIVTPVMVDGQSMDNTLQNNQMLLLNKLDKKYERFEIVVFKYKKNRLIKRVIGLPGDKISIKDNKLYINDKLIEEKYVSSKSDDFDLSILGIDKIPEDYYFVMGDNRKDSYDSRYFGLVNKKNIEGTVKYRLFPFNKFGKI